MLHDARKHAGNVSACSLCLSCDNVCPAEVAPGSQIYVWRQMLDSIGKADPLKEVMSMGMKVLFDSPMLYQTTLKFAPFINRVPEQLTKIGSLNPWGIGHAKPEFAEKSFHQLWKEGGVK